MPTRPYHIPYAKPARSYHIPCHAIDARPCHIPCHARQAIPYTMSCHILCHASPDHTLYHVMPAICHACQAHTIYHAMPARLYHASSGHTLYNAMPVRPYLFPCHAHQAIPYTMPFQPEHTIYHAMPRQAITYTISCQPDHTIYLTMPTRSCHIPCHATANDYFGKSCHLSKGATVSLPDARLLVNSRWFRFIVCLCGSAKFMWKQARIIFEGTCSDYTQVSNCINYFWQQWKFSRQDVIMNQRLKSYMELKSEHCVKTCV